jgi:predicted DNA-binding transcriptional regulator AlpA
MEISLAESAVQPLMHRGYVWEPGRPVMLSPENAMQILDVRLGITVGRSTFYRWIQTGRFFSIKLGGKIFVPLSEIETVVQKLSHGERL